MIPNIIPPFPDELTHSYVKRLADANCLSTAGFYGAYLSDNGSPAKYYDNDMFRIFDRLWKTLDGSGVTVVDLLRTTLLPVLAPFMRDEKRDTYLLKMFGYPETLGIMNSKCLTGRLCYCPECRREDTKAHGMSYLHRMHHLPGINVCPIHHVPLINTKSGEAITGTNLGVQAGYERLILDLLHDPITCSYKEFRTGLLRKLSEITTHPSPYTEISKFLTGTGYEACRDAADASRYLSTGNLPIDIMLRLAGHCFSSGAEAHAYVRHKDDGEQFASDAHTLGFTVTGHSLFPAEMIHDACGTRFYTSADSFRNGYRCPVCDGKLSSQGLFNRIVRCSANGEYTAETEYSGLSRKVKFRHNVCEQTFETSAKQFLYEGRRCNCGRIYTEEKAHGKVRDVGDYEIVTYSNMDGPCRIRACACNHEFSIGKLRKFLARPYCRACRPARSDEKRFCREVADLTGSEYTYVSGYSGRMSLIVMRHNSVCGSHDFTTYPTAFLAGQRCPYCKKQVRKTDFSRIVRELSSGRYEVTGFKGDTRCIIRDTVSGTEREFERGFVLQELYRPTPSEALPHVAVDTSGYCRNTMERVLKAAAEIFPPGSSTEIRASEVHVDGMTRAQVLRVMNQQLVKAGYFRKKQRCIYEWKEFLYGQEKRENER